MTSETNESGFLSSFLSKGLKTNQLEVNTDEKTLRPIARLKEPRDLFALPRDKENDCPQQAPRWPIECQVIEERIIHVPYVPAQAEPYYQPTGNELKPHPVGEDAGVVVFNYNPISAVNYEVKAVKLAAESSDSDISSSESRASTPKESNSILTMTENPFEKMLGTKNPFSQMLERLHPRSSSNSNEEEDDDEENDDDEDDEEEDEAEPPSTVMRQKGGADEIEDIWANKSPEYQPATPNYIKSQFGKKINKSYEQQQKEESHFIAPVRYNRKQMARFNTSIKSSSNSTLCSQTEEITNTENLLTHVKSFENRPKFKRIKKETEEIPASKLYEQNVENFEKTFKPPSLQAQIELLTVRLSGGLTPDSQLAKKLENMNRNNTTNYRSDLTNKTETTSNFIPLLPQFSRSAVGGSKILTNCHPSSYDEAGEHLEFESRFESGNLAKAVKITESYYELYLRPDLYTSRSKQWFYFRVRRTKKSMTYRFSIVNLVKSDSLYNEGMRPLMYSCIAADKLREGWRRCGDNIRYYRNDDDGNTNDEDDENASYTLTFNIEFAYDDDTVFFAHSYPYTYSDLQEYLMDIQKHPVKSKFCKLRLLCRSLAGNNVYYLTVTAPTADEEAMRRKKSVVVSARVHPSETPASWMMKGLMDFITGDSIVAKRLRHKFIFKLIPMLNPDGVIVGNTRNSLTGKDLNRQYRTVIRETYPSIWYTKAMIKRLIDECGIAMYCDMHAHSRKHNIFIYGCENRRTPEKKLIEQVFPLMMHKNVADKFSFESCKFKIQRSKEGTGRIVMWMLGITNSYTIEASFGGSSLGSRKGTHFNTTDYEHMGRAFCETLLDYCDENPNKERLRLKIIERLLKEGSSADEPLNIPLSDYSSDEGDTSSSSDNEGKDSFSVSDLEGPCCAPLRAPPTSPENHVSLRRFKIKRMRKVMSELDRIYFQPVFKKKFRSIIRGKKKKTKKSRKEQPVVNNSSESEEESDDSSNELENTAILGCKMKVNFKTISNKPNEESIELNSNARKKVMLSNVPSKQNDDKLRLAEKTSNLVKTQKVARPSGGSEKPKSRATSSRTNTAKNSKVKLEQPLLCPTGSLDMSLLPLGVQKIGTKTNKKPSKKNKQISKKKSSPSGTDVQKEEKATRRKRLKVSRVLRLWLENRKIMIYRQKRKTRPRKCTTIRKKRDGADRTPLDMPTTDPGSDILFSTDDECCIGNRVQETFYGTVPRSRRTLLLQSELQRRYIEEIGDGTTGPQKQMPPELVVTSPTKPHTAQYDKQTTLLQEAPQTAPGKFGLNELSMRSELCARTSSWQNLHSTKFSSTKLRLQNTYYKEQRATNDELQLKLSLKKKIWTGIQPDNLILTLDNTRSLQRSLSPLPIKKDTRKEIKKDKKDENELLLTACSQKLIAWQHSGSTTSNTVLSETKKQQLTVNLILRDVKEAQHNRSNTKINHAKNVQKSVIKTDLTYSDTGKLKLKKNSLTKIAETTQLITRLAKARSRPLILTAKKITKSSMPLNAIQQSTQTAVSKGLLGANKFKTGGIVATAVQSKYISRRKKTVNVISNTLEKSQQRPIDITNLDSTAILPSRNEPAHGLVRKVKSKLKKKKRASSANATGK